MPFNLSTGEILVLLVVAIIVFGGNLPEVARKIGRTISDFKRGMRDEMHRIDPEVAGGGPPPDWDPPPDGEDCVGFGDDPPDADEPPADEDKGEDEPEPDGKREPTD